jgi:hypothetical protein
VSIKRDDLKVIFVHSDIDDLGLSIYEFRIYAHIARRAGDGECFPSILAIAKHCRISEDTVRETIQHLIAYKLISREDRPGTSPLYRLTSSKEWARDLVGTFESKSTVRKRNQKQLPPPGLGDGLFTPPGLREGYGIEGGHPSGIEGGHPSGIEGDEVHPIKLIQSKVIQGTPKSSFHTEFIAGWDKKFSEMFGCKYRFNGRDGKAVKELKKLNMPAEDLLAIADYAWENFKSDRFYGPHSKTVYGFLANFNHFQTEASQVTNSNRFGLPE